MSKGHSHGPDGSCGQKDDELELAHNFSSNVIYLFAITILFLLWYVFIRSTNPEVFVISVDMLIYSSFMPLSGPRALCLSEVQFLLNL